MAHTGQRKHPFQNTLNYVWDTGVLDWVVMTQAAAGGGGTQYTEDAPAAANPIGTAVNLVRRDTPGAEVSTDGDNIAQRGSNFGASYVTLLDNAGNFVSVGGGTQYTEDAVSAADPIGTQLISRRRDTLSSEVSLDGDVIAVNSTAKGELYVKHVDSVAITAASLPLPTGASTSANQSTEITALQIIDDPVDSGNAVERIAWKPIAASTYAPTRFVDLGANATANVKATAGNVFSLYCNNENAADRFVQLHNTATTPGAGATPVYTFRVPAGGDVLVGTDFFTAMGAHFTTGIAFAFSTTKDTYTAATAGDQSTIVMYV